MRKVKLSKAGVSYLAHRLEVGDAIADALTDTEGVPYSFEECMDAADRLLSRVRSGSVWAESDVERLVLRDAVEGSTWWAVNAEDLLWEVHPSRYGLALANVERSIEATTEKVGEYLGEDLEPVFH